LAKGNITPTEISNIKAMAIVLNISVLLD